jgi:uncharacterized membrane protein HdeD (DUF308 family)
MIQSTTTPSVRRASGWGIAYAILIILVGLLAISLPFASGIGVTIAIGWLLLLSGIFHIAEAFHPHDTGSVIWRVLVGVVYVVGGLELIFHPAFGLITLTFVLAIILCVQGAIGLIAFFQHRTLPGAPWILINAIITLFLGLLIWREGAYAAVWVIGTLVGINLIFNGISRLMLWSGARRSLLSPVV